MVRLQMLTLNPFEMAPSNISALKFLLETATNLKTLNIDISGTYVSKIEVGKSQLPTTTSVEEFILELWHFKTDEDLTNCIGLFLNSIDVIFPSLRKFSLNSRRRILLTNDTKREPRNIQLGSSLKNLARLQYLHTLNIDCDICKSVTLEGLEKCENLKSLTATTRMLIESVELKNIPQNITNLDLRYPLLSLLFSPGHQQLLAGCLNSLSQSKNKNENLMTLTLFRYEIYPKTASLMKFSSLTKLHLIHCAIKDSDLLQILRLRNLVSLKELSLAETRVYDNQGHSINQLIFEVLEKAEIIEQLEILDLSDFGEVYENLRPPKTPGNFKSLRKLVARRSACKVVDITDICHAPFPLMEEIHLGNLKCQIENVINLLKADEKTCRKGKTIYFMIDTTEFDSGKKEKRIAQAVRKFDERHHGLMKVRFDMLGYNKPLQNDI